jgi:hypothetical protein
MSFAGFTAADFDAYQPKKWKSNAFNRERLEVKQKLVAFGRALEGAMLAADGSPLAVEPSVEHPALWNHKQVEAQHLFFSRNEGARKELDKIIDRQKSIAAQIDDPTPLRNHVFLAVSLTNDALELSVRLHPDAKVDRQNLERKCEDHFEREKLLALVHKLGDGFRAGVTPELKPADSVDDAALGAMLTALAQPQPPILPPGTPQRLLYIGRAIARADAQAAGAAAIEQARAGLDALLPIYRFIAWSRDNDFVSMREALQKEKQQKRQKGLQPKDTVRIVRGMFAGKSGVIQEIDAKGGLKVLVGKVAVKVDVEDVTK